MQYTCIKHTTTPYYLNFAGHPHGGSEIDITTGGSEIDITTVRTIIYQLVIFALLIPGKPRSAWLSQHQERIVLILVRP